MDVGGLICHSAVPTEVVYPKADVALFLSHLKVEFLQPPIGNVLYDAGCHLEMIS